MAYQEEKNILLSWEDHITIAAAFVKPRITGWDKKSTSFHNLHIPKVSWIIQTISAKKAAYTAYQVTQVIAKGSKAEAVIRDTMATGHVANCLELHHNAEIITGKKEAYNQ